MPILMNKGANATQAAWLFYSNRETLQAFADAVMDQRLDGGRLVYEPADFEQAKKASSELTISLEAETVIPDDFDLDGYAAEILAGFKGEITQIAQAAQDMQDKQKVSGDHADTAASDTDAASGKTSDGTVGPNMNSGAGDDANTQHVTGNNECSDTGEDIKNPSADNNEDRSEEEEKDEGEEEDEEELPYDPIPAPTALRIPLGSTTRSAVETYLVHAGEDTEAWDARLPGLTTLAQLVHMMQQTSKGLPPYMVWHIDEAGILRMSPAKDIKAIAGNVIKVRL